MTNSQIKSALQSEVKAKGYPHLIKRVYELAPYITAIQFDRPLSITFLEWLNTRFSNGVTEHEYFVVAINAPKQA